MLLSSSKLSKLDVFVMFSNTQTGQLCRHSEAVMLVVLTSGSVKLVSTSTLTLGQQLAAIAPLDSCTAAAYSSTTAKLAIAAKQQARTSFLLRPLCRRGRPSHDGCKQHCMRCIPGLHSTRYGQHAEVACRCASSVWALTCASCPVML